jgi:hypothetical protein
MSELMMKASMDWAVELWYSKDGLPKVLLFSFKSS